MAFASPSRSAACLAIVLLHKDLVSAEPPVTQASEWIVRVKHVQLVGEIQKLAKSALEGSLFCEDIAEIEHLYARKNKDVPDQMRQLMRAHEHVIRLRNKEEQQRRARHFDAARTFLHREQVQPPVLVASDGTPIGFHSDKWVLLDSITAKPIAIPQ